jgi:hypothetical protein
VFIGVTAGTNAIKDDGTITTEWVKQAPAGALAVVVETGTPLVVGNGTYTAGEGVGSGTNTATITVNSTTFRAQFTAALGTGGTNLNTNVTEIGDLGVDYLSIMFSDPGALIRVSRDYSIEDTAFTNYYHTEMDVDIIFPEPSMPDIDTLIEGAINVGTSTTTNLDTEDKLDMQDDARREVRAPVTRLSKAKDVFNVWAVPRTRFELINKDQTNASWDNIKAVRVVVECSKTCVVTLGTWEILGATGTPLNDTDLGYSWWETFATVEGGEITSESAASPSSVRTKMQHARAALTSTNTVTGTVHGLTHRVWYRQGGMLNEPYAIATYALATTSATDVLTDIQALSLRRKLPRNILARSEFPQNIVHVAGPYKERVFVGYENFIRWSQPGRPDTFPRTSITTVSHKGDEVYGLVSWAPTLVIINRDSIYELQGNVFEPPNQDWILHRTGSRKGTKAQKSVVKTPYGIPLIDYDGLSLYIPGQGIDQPLAWAMEKLGDVFKGIAPTDPAALKGNRIPALNHDQIHKCCAAYADDKLYLGMPCGSAQVQCNYLFVLDFRLQQLVGVYNYPFNFISLFWDVLGNKLFAGSPDGKLMQLETTLQDSNSADTRTNIPFKVRTRTWSTPSDGVLENISVELTGGTATLSATIDGTATALATNLSQTTRDWSTPAMLGRVANNVSFELSGTAISTAQTAFYGVLFDALIEPRRVVFYKTDYDISNWDAEKQYDVHYGDIEIIGTGNVLATCLVEGTAVMTHTMSGPTSGRHMFVKAYPIDTYGRVAHTIYNAGTGVVFKHWKTTYGVRNEPPKINNWKTDMVSLEENICDGVDVDINPNGTVTSIVYVDSTAVGTFTNTGTKRQSFTNSLPNELYGRTIWAEYFGTLFKHYQSWFHLREEPDRWINFVTDKTSENEKRWERAESDIDLLGTGNTVEFSVFVDNSNVRTTTYTGTANTRRQSFVIALPAGVYGRTIWGTYSMVGTGRFKHHKTWFEGEDEPDRVHVHRTSDFPFPSDQNLRTWVPELNPLGTCTGVLYADDVAISTKTFTGTERQFYNVGIDVDSASAIRKANRLVAVYTCPTTSRFKHYSTDFETTAKPFGKTTWSIAYQKIGGASQLDIPRTWTFDVEAQGTATVTSIWDVDGTALTTDTMTVTAREYRDRIPFPEGGRGYIFQQRITSDQPIKVWRSTLDTMRVGVKGLSRLTFEGTPKE